MVNLYILNTDDLSFIPLMSEKHGVPYDEETLEVTFSDEFWSTLELPEACNNMASGSTWTTDCQYSREHHETYDGTYGNWIYASGGAAWNSHTFEDTLWLSCWDINLGKAVDTGTCQSGQTAEYSALYKNHIWIVGRDKSLYLKYDLDTKTGVAIDVFDAGFIAQNYTVFNDVVLVEVISGSTSNKEYLELNLNSGELINRGVISEGDRIVLEFLPITIST